MRTFRAISSKNSLCFFTESNRPKETEGRDRVHGFWGIHYLAGLLGFLLGENQQTSSPVGQLRGFVAATADAHKQKGGAPPRDRRCRWWHFPNSAPSLTALDQVTAEPLPVYVICFGLLSCAAECGERDRWKRCYMGCCLLMGLGGEGLGRLRPRSDPCPGNCRLI